MSDNPYEAPKAKVRSRSQSKSKSKSGRTRRNHATFLQRLIAFILDSLITGAVTTAFAYLLIADFDLLSDARQPTLYYLASTAWPAVYTIGFWVTKGATLGKMLFGLQVETANGSMPSVGSSLLRYIGYFVSGIALSIGYLWMLGDNDSQTWHDKMAGTFVVKK